MNIETKKLDFIQDFLTIQNVEIINQLENLLHKLKKSEAENDLKPFSIEELQERIAQSEKDFEQKRFKTSSELLSKYRYGF